MSTPQCCLSSLFESRTSNPSKRHHSDRILSVHGISLTLSGNYHFNFRTIVVGNSSSKRNTLRDNEQMLYYHTPTGHTRTSYRDHDSLSTKSRALTDDQTDFRHFTHAGSDVGEDVGVLGAVRIGRHWCGPANIWRTRGYRTQRRKTLSQPAWQAKPAVSGEHNLRRHNHHHQERNFQRATHFQPTWRVRMRMVLLSFWRWHERWNAKQI